MNDRGESLCCPGLRYVQNLWYQKHMPSIAPKSMTKGPREGVWERQTDKLPMCVVELVLPVN